MFGMHVWASRNVSGARNTVLQGKRTPSLLVVINRYFALPNVTQATLPGTQRNRARRRITYIAACIQLSERV